jgi:hypothetical protein
MMASNYIGAVSCEECKRKHFELYEQPLIIKYHVCAYSFNGKYKEDETGPADLKMGIMCDPINPAMGIKIFATKDTRDQAVGFIKEQKDGNAYFILEVFEVQQIPMSFECEDMAKAEK